MLHHQQKCNPDYGQTRVKRRHMTSVWLKPQLLLSNVSFFTKSSWLCVCVLWWMYEERARDCCKCYDSDRLELCLLYCGSFYSLHMDIETLKWSLGLEKTLLANKLTNTKAWYKKNCSRSDRERAREETSTSTKRDRYREKLIKWHTAILFIVSYKTNRKYLQKTTPTLTGLNSSKTILFFWSNGVPFVFWTISGKMLLVRGAGSIPFIWAGRGGAGQGRGWGARGSFLNGAAVAGWDGISLGTEVTGMGRGWCGVMGQWV